MQYDAVEMLLKIKSDGSLVKPSLILIESQCFPRKLHRVRISFNRGFVLSSKSWSHTRCP